MATLWLSYISLICNVPQHQAWWQAREYREAWILLQENKTHPICKYSDHLLEAPSVRTVYTPLYKWDTCFCLMLIDWRPIKQIGSELINLYNWSKSGWLHSDKILLRQEPNLHSQHFGRFLQNEWGFSLPISWCLEGSCQVFSRRGHTPNQSLWGKHFLPAYDSLWCIMRARGN